MVDVFDALATERPYKRAMEIENVESVLRDGRGTFFDPFLVDVFLDVLQKRYQSE